MVVRPNAPAVSVTHIVNAFKGRTAGIDNRDESWLVTFPTVDATVNAKHLITMLGGWDAKTHPTAENTIKIFCP
tara:strand:- start:548 stop:769 length:222 start_codon:yes stop_codon:yes gene_type:complete